MELKLDRLELKKNRTPLQLVRTRIRVSTRLRLKINHQLVVVDKPYSANKYIYHIKSNSSY